MKHIGLREGTYASIEAKVNFLARPQPKQINDDTIK